MSEQDCHPIVQHREVDVRVLRFVVGRGLAVVGRQGREKEHLEDRPEVIRTI